MRLKKVIILLVLCMIFICLIPKKTLATTITDGNLKNIVENPKMKDVGKATTGGRIQKVLNTVIKLIQLAGTAVSVIMVTMLGIKYMLSSSTEKAEIKKTAMPIIIGCVLLFAAVNLVGIIADIGVNL